MLSAAVVIGVLRIKEWETIQNNSKPNEQLMMS